MGRAYDLALVFVATVLGLLIRYFETPSDVLWPLGILMAIALIVRCLGQYGLSKSDPSAVVLVAMACSIYFWSAGIFAVIAMVTWGLQEGAYALVAVFASDTPPLTIPEAERASALKAITAAIGGFVGALFFSDAKKPDSAFWPAQVFQAVVRKQINRYKKLNQIDYPDLYGALNDDRSGLLTKPVRFPVALLRGIRVGSRGAQAPWSALR